MSKCETCKCYKCEEAECNCECHKKEQSQK